MKLWIDLLRSDDPGPRPGDYLQAIGRRGTLNSAYFVLSTRVVQRRDPKAFRRISMEVEKVTSALPKKRREYTFHWYPRRKKTTASKSVNEILARD